MYTRREFNVDGRRVWLVQCVKDGAPAVACVVELVDYPELHSLSVYFTMKSATAAARFVLVADDATATRGYQKLMDEHRPILDMFNRCLSAPMPPAWKLQGKR